MSRLTKGKSGGDLGMEHDYPTQDTIKLIFTDYDELKETVDKIMEEGMILNLNLAIMRRWSIIFFWIGKTS
jgi:hypothetical protein